MKKVGDTAGAALDLKAALGLMDEPDCQRQEELIHDLAKEGNIGIFGAGATGKSTMLMDAALGLAIKNSPESLNYYVIDLGNSALISLKNLPHTADYLTFDDTEKMGKLVKLLTAEMSDRKKKFGRLNATSLEGYNRVADEKLRAIIVFVDNYDVIKEMDPQGESFFTSLSRDGASLGIYLAVTASRTNSMKYAVLNSLQLRISLYMTESSEVTSVVGRSEYKLSDIKGRGLVKKTGVCILQGYLPAMLEDEVEYQNSIVKLTEAIADATSARRAKGIPMLPDKLMLEQLIASKDSEEIAVGLDAENVLPDYIQDSGVTLILGGSGTGKTNMMKVIYEQAKDSRVYLADSKSGELHYACDELGSRYIASAEDDIEAFIAGISAAASKREARYNASDRSKAPRQFYRELEKQYILIDDAAYLTEIAGAALPALGKAIQQAADTGIQIIASADPRAIPLTPMNDFIKALKNTSFGILLGTVNQSVFNVGMSKMTLSEDTAAVYSNGSLEKIKVPKAD